MAVALHPRLQQRGCAQGWYMLPPAAPTSPVCWPLVAAAALSGQRVFLPSTCVLLAWGVFTDTEARLETPHVKHQANALKHQVHVSACDLSAAGLLRERHHSACTCQQASPSPALDQHDVKCCHQAVCLHSAGLVTNRHSAVVSPSCAESRQATLNSGTRESHSAGGSLAGPYIKTHIAIRT